MLKDILQTAFLGCISAVIIGLLALLALYLIGNLGVLLTITLYTILAVAWGVFIWRTYE